MEKAVEVLLPPQPDVVTSPPAAAPAEDTPLPKAAGAVDPMEEFGRRLQDIITAHGSAADAQVEAEGEETDATGDVGEAEVSAIMQSLNKLSSAEEKLKHLVKKHASLTASQRCDRNKLQHRLSVLLEERRSSAAARGKLESLCRDLQAHYKELREENLQRCREDEQKRSDITCHFQKMLMEIQVQIEQHSTRNDKLCRENANLTDKLESLLQQCEQREESQEKINRHRDLQHQLTEAKLEQANALLADAEEKHKREKEYLLREAIDKTKKCFAMKEQELAMKKKLTLYSEKFDEFQATLAKSNEIYGHFKKEMEKMSEKMKKLEKESNVWKLRFENCNKALTDMIEERSEKGKEYDLFVLKIQKLEKLCRSLQDERKVLYDKIKDVRQANASLPAKIFGGSQLLPEEIQELQELQEGDPVLTEDMARLKEQQAKLQEFAASLLITAEDKEEEQEEKEHLGPEEDLLASAFVQFQTKPQIKPEPVSTEPTPEEKPSPEPTPEEKPSPELTPEEKPSPKPTPEEKSSPEPTPEKKPSPELTPEEKSSPEEKPSPEPTPEKKPSPEPTPEEKPSPELTPEEKSSPEEKPSPEPTPEEKPQQQPHLPPAEVLVQPVQPAEPPHVPTGAARSNPAPPAATSREAPKKKKKKTSKNVC